MKEADSFTHGRSLGIISHRFLKLVSSILQFGLEELIVNPCMELEQRLNLLPVELHLNVTKVSCSSRPKTMSYMEQFNEAYHLSEKIPWSCVLKKVC